MAVRYPTSLKALVLQKPSEHRKPVYHNVRIVEKSIPGLKPGELLVRINAAGFNHREVGMGCVNTMALNVTYSTCLSFGFAKVSIQGLPSVAPWVQMGLVSTTLRCGHGHKCPQTSLILRGCYFLVRRSRRALEQPGFSRPNARLGERPYRTRGPVSQTCLISAQSVRK